MSDKRKSNLIKFYGIIFFLVISKVNSIQKFSEQPHYTEVNPNQDALLACKIIDRKGSCSWQKDNKPVGIYPKKYEWASGNSNAIGSQMHSSDCSLWIRKATLEFDDGFWECQVTASDFITQDALTSQPVKLVVRVAPQKPKLEHEGQNILPGSNVTVDAGAIATVKCVSHYGNPPAIIKWFLGDQEIAPLHPQINSSEPDNPKTWSATAVVQVPATKERQGMILKCLAFHEYYSARTVGVEAKMDVRYSPTIKLQGSPQIDLEEGKDSLTLRCEANANPPASIVWRRAGRPEIASLTESLQLRPVSRRDSGLYSCQAQNSVGTSDALSVQLDIKYPPRIIAAGPDRLITATLYSQAVLECIAEGNPTPTYKWVQRITSQGNVWLERGRESRLVIANVTYDFQGEYECRANNFINGQKRSSNSDTISLQVVGAPQVLRSNSSMYQVIVKRGESASLTLVVCADPRPRHVAWEWGSLRLEAGAGIGRFRVDDVTQDKREDCYLATLHINQADVQDSRPYYLVVENDRGADRHSVMLTVEGVFPETLGITYFLGITAVCAAVLLILICWCVYIIRNKNQNKYKATDKDSEKTDLKPRHDLIGVPHLEPTYATSSSARFHLPTQRNIIHGSPEAMKHDANLVLSSIRHHRDLFSGGSSLGIPDVNTHVGSVIHAFETLAHQRQVKENEETLEKMYKATKPNSNHVERDSIYKIILPPHSLRQNAVLDDLTKKVVRHQKRKAPVPEPLLINNISESTASDSMSLDDNGFKSYREMPKFYAKNNKVLPPFPSTVSQGTQIPLKKKLSSNKKERNDNRVSDNFLLLSKTKPDDPYTKSFKKPLKNNLKNTLENDFLRGSTVSQSFIKNVVKKPPSHKISTYEQNFLIDPKRNKDEEKSLDNEVKMRYKQYKSYDDKNFYDKKRNDFQPQATVEL